MHQRCVYATSEEEATTALPTLYTQGDQDSASVLATQSLLSPLSVMFNGAQKDLSIFKGKLLS